MVLSNLSSNVDVESRAMATMGDTLGRSGAGVNVEVGGPACPGVRAAVGVWRATGLFPSCGLYGVSCPRVEVFGRTWRH